MTEQDLDRIEADLGIILPLVYRQLVCPFPIPTYAGNGERSSMSLWDSAEDLIRFNRELRMGSRFQKAWPAYMFALGRDGTGCTEAIDLRDPNHHVLWINCCDINQIPSDYGTSPSLNSWAAEYLENQRVMLLENGVHRTIWGVWHWRGFNLAGCTWCGGGSGVVP